MYKNLFIATLIFLSLGATAQTKRIVTSQPLLTATKKLEWWFKYWTPTDVKAPLVSLIIQRRACGIADAEVYLETVATDLNSRRIVFQALYDFTQGNRDYLFQNLQNIGLTAVNASVITNYIIANYPIKVKEPVLSKKEIEEQEAKLKEEKILDTVLLKRYNLNNYKAAYNDFYYILKYTIKDRINNNYLTHLPPLSTIELQPFTYVHHDILDLDDNQTQPSEKPFNGFYTYNVSYNYTLEEKDTESDNTESIETPELISGNDADHLFKNLHLHLPKLTIPVNLPILGTKGVLVGNKIITLNNLDINIVRGITVMEVKKGTIRFTRFPPSDNFQKLISDKVDAKMKGRYIVKYEFGNLFTDTINNVIILSH